MTLKLVTFIYDFLYAKCYAIHIVLDRIKSNQIIVIIIIIIMIMLIIVIMMMTIILIMMLITITITIIIIHVNLDLTDHCTTDFCI